MVESSSAHSFPFASRKKGKLLVQSMDEVEEFINQPAVSEDVVASKRQKYGFDYDYDMPSFHLLDNSEDVVAVTPSSNMEIETFCTTDNLEKSTI